jgi:hypothetical protein
MNIRSYGSSSDPASSAEALRRIQASEKVDQRLKKRDFGFKLGKLGVFYSSESVEYEPRTQAANSPGPAAPVAADKAAFQRYLPSNDPPRRYFGKFDATPASDDGVQTDPRRKKIQAYANMAMGLNDPLSRPSRLLAVV